MEHIWHIKNKNFKKSESLSSVLNILYQEGCTYIMDNHLAAVGVGITLWINIKNITFVILISMMI